MTTDTSERGLERLICEALTGEPCDPPLSGTDGEPIPGYGGVGWSPGNGRDYDREYCVDLVQLRAFLVATQPKSAAAFRLAGGLPQAPEVPGPASGPDQQTRHHRRTPARHQARPPRPGTLPRHPVSGERDGPAALRVEPLHGHPTATLQPGRDPAGARHRAVHQRSSRLHFRTQEQPDEADGPRRRPAIREGPQPEGAALPARALRCALRGETRAKSVSAPT